MPKTDRRTRRPPAAEASKPVAAVAGSHDSAQPGAETERDPLVRIAETPHLARAVAHLPAELLHDVIRRCGLEAAGELLMLATAQQLAAVFDLDLWRTERRGEERFDPARFCDWLDVLVESSVSGAARKVAEMDPDLAAAGLALQIAVFDPAVLSASTDEDDGDVEVSAAGPGGVRCDVGGYAVVGRRSDSWDTIIGLLMALSQEHPESFHRLMRRCRRLSNSEPEVDGLHDLLTESEQVLFDLKIARERRREQQGYVTPPQARAFLDSSRQLRFEQDDQPPASPIYTAYLREVRWSDESQRDQEASSLSEPGAPAASESTSARAAVAVLLEAGIVPTQPVALLSGPQEDKAALARLQELMRFARDRDYAAAALRTQELAFLANVLRAGCSVQDRALTTREAFDAAAATCNLGLENWPRRWLARSPPPPAAQGTTPLPDDFLVHQDLVAVFQAGWAVLHTDVVMFVAEQLLATLAAVTCSDREIDLGLRVLRRELKKHWRAGAPWQARGSLDVLASLDMAAWAAVAGLIDELPVVLSNVSASAASRPLSVSTSAFEYIADNSQIAQVRAFMERLPGTLSGGG